MHLKPNKVALVGAVMVGGWHVVWSLFVLLGWSQTLINFSMWAHMFHADIVFGSFDIMAALTVIVVATIIGYCAGYIFATVWNRVHASA